MKLSIFKKEKISQPQTSSVEAFNIWHALRGRYGSVETFQLFDNFVHDRDLTIILNNRITEYQKQLNQLESLAKKYKVKVPSRPPKKIILEEPSDEISDKMIYRHIYRDVVYELSATSRGISTSTTNDTIRAMFADFGLKHLEFHQTVNKYGRLKGWTEIGPAFSSNKETKNEPLSVSEANHLWDHLNLRYDQIHMTNLFRDFIHDVDFKEVLDLGVKELSDQIILLEDNSIKYGIPLPERPPASQLAGGDPETIEDKFVYRIIFKGIQDAIDLHIRSVVETIRNDSLRNIFLDLYKKEVALFDKYLKYGKMKGWTHIMPLYKKG